MTQRRNLSKVDVQISSQGCLVVFSCCLLRQCLIQSCARVGRRIVEGMCYWNLRHKVTVSGQGPVIGFLALTHAHRAVQWYAVVQLIAVHSGHAGEQTVTVVARRRPRPAEGLCTWNEAGARSAKGIACKLLWTLLCPYQIQINSPQSFLLHARSSRARLGAARLRGFCGERVASATISSTNTTAGHRH